MYNPFRWNFQLTQPKSWLKILTKSPKINIQEIRKNSAPFSSLVQFFEKELSAVTTSFEPVVAVVVVVVVVVVVAADAAVT